MIKHNSRSSVDMLQGNILRNMIVFALPLIATGVMQQSFNSIDMVIVGKFVGHHALAAVGSNGPVINLIVNLFLGISVGVNVVISNYIGRKDHNGVKRSVATAAALAIVSGLVMVAISFSVASPILKSLGTPDEVLNDATDYLRLYSLGMPLMMIFNFGSAILRSFGDTRRPFYALAAGGVINVALNLLFVIVCGMGVKGVAIATVISNGVSALWIYIVLRREKEPFKVEPRQTNLKHKVELRKIMQIGLPAGIQGMVFSLSNVFVQSAINSYGADAIAGSAAAINYELYGYFIISAFTQSVVAFTGQNYGAGNLRRCRSVMLVGLLLSFVCSVVFDALVVGFDGETVRLFTDAPAVMDFAIIRLHCGVAFQWVACSYEISGASLRGQGFSSTPMFITIAGTCVLRLAWVFITQRFSMPFATLMWIYPISWVVTGIAMVVARIIVSRKLAAKTA